MLAFVSFRMLAFVSFPLILLVHDDGDGLLVFGTATLGKLIYVFMCVPYAIPII